MCFCILANPPGLVRSLPDFLEYSPAPAGHTLLLKYLLDCCPSLSTCITTPTYLPKTALIVVFDYFAAYGLNYLFEMATPKKATYQRKFQIKWIKHYLGAFVKSYCKSLR